MIREIVTYPNRFLQKKSTEVEAFDKELHTLLDDMYETMIIKEGIGLAAVQIKVLKRIFIINVPDKDGEQNIDDLIEAINPEIIEATGEIIYEEGCLSVPGFLEEVKRPNEIKVRFYDRFGKPKTLLLDGLSAVAFQHEMDHLNGHLFIEKISYIKRKKFDKEWKKEQKNKKKKK